MDIGSILIGLALALLVAAFLGRPLLMHGGQDVTPEDRHLSELQAQRDQVLTQLQELDMDYAMSKIIPEDYKLERQGLMRQGAEVFKNIDTLTGLIPAPVLSESPGDAIEAAVASLRGAARASSAGFCRSCGAEAQLGDIFCTRCGKSLQVVEGEN
ncbi:MAG: zinc ribbon domain-containing protein [Anaerolineales bacterium]|nr:MAG: zinc ribbon domain-containing protein [Anaerolineales bacterium]